MEVKNQRVNSYDKFDFAKAVEYANWSGTTCTTTSTNCSCSASVEEMDE